MSNPEIFWLKVDLPGRLAIMPRPRADDWLVDEVVGYRNSGIDAIVSLLQASEVRELGLTKESAICAANNLDFISFPFPDRGVPESRLQTLKLCEPVLRSLNSGRSVAIHCRMGIGRSALLAACVMVLSDFKSGEAFDCISEARGVVVPDTESQRNWVSAFEDWVRLH